LARQVEVVHAVVPGRLRVLVPDVRGDPEELEAAVAALGALVGVALVLSNLVSGSLLSSSRRSAHAEVVRQIEQALARRAVGVGDVRTWDTGRVGVRDAFGSDAKLRWTVLAEAHSTRWALAVLPRSESRFELNVLRDRLFDWPTVMLGSALLLSALTGGLAEALASLAVGGVNALVACITASRSECAVCA
jgi:P-type Ca2+ transporter type 2C